MEQSKEIKVYRCPICYKLYYEKKDADFCHQDRTCTTCGKVIGKKDYYDTCQECRNKVKKENMEKKFDKAEKISYIDYDGYFLYGNEERVKDIDELADYIYESILDDNDYIPPTYLFGLKKTPVFDLDIYDILEYKTEDGYEDMYSFLDTKSELLSDIQLLMDKWVKLQGDYVYTYYEDYTKAILLEDLIKDIRNQIKNEKKAQ